MSTIALDPALPATAPTTMGLDGSCSNVPPKYGADRRPHRSDGRDGDDGNQRDQEPVLEQVLAFVSFDEATDDSKHSFHDGPPATRTGARRERDGERPTPGIALDRTRSERARDGAKDPIDALARRGHGHDSHQRDESDEQRVL